MGCNCGYWWEDLNEYGEPISLAYCHYDGPDEWAPCEQDSNNEYANEADIEEREAKEEAEYMEWLELIPMEQRPTNAKEYVESWKQYRAMYE